MYTLFLKEIKSFLTSLAGYISIGVFLTITGTFLWIIGSESTGGFNILDNGFASIDPLFSIAPMVYLFLIPAITMRSFAEEKKTGTIELLFTRPLTELQIILAKYFAGVALVAVSLLPTLFYYYSVYKLGYPPGNIDSGGTWGSYIGLLLLGAGFVSIGIFASSLTDNQVIAFILAMAMCFLCFSGFEYFAVSGMAGKLEPFIAALGISSHYASLSRGVIDTRDLLYFASLVAFFVLLTRFVLEKRKWQTGAEKAEGKSVKSRHITQLLATFVILLLLNYAGSYYFKRFDLTSEKRYTLNAETVDMLKNLDDHVYMKVYLAGDFNSSFTRLKNEAKEMMDEFRVYAKKGLDYEFINIYDPKYEKELVSIQRQLYEKGIDPYDYRSKSQKGQNRQVLFPGAVVYYKGKEAVWQIFKQQVGMEEAISVNNSVETLEYGLSNTIRKIQRPIRPRVAFVRGHHELDTNQTKDMYFALNEYYDVDFMRIRGRLRSLKPYSAIILAWPDTVINERDKFVIDQFIMHGGKVLWCLEPVYTNTDSLNLKGYTLGLENNINLNDMLFSYGVRVNPALVQDMQCGAIPVNRGFKGGQPDIQMFPWIYKPLVLPTSDHPIVKNLDLIRFEFAGTLDTVKAVGVKKTVLLASSKYSRTQAVPARVALAMVSNRLNEKKFNDGNKPMAVLLEGTFTSNYENRINDTIANDSAIAFRNTSLPTAQIVISDGDVIKNGFNYQTMAVNELGYDKYMKQTFANKTFLLNCMNYLIDGPKLMSIRTREVKLRLLDRKKTDEDPMKWKMYNVLFPLLIVAASGYILTLIRKRRFSVSK